MLKEEYNPKHAPVIEVEKEGELFKVTVEVGKEVKHPNEPAHNIEWVDLYFQSEGEEVIHLARVEFKAHEEALTEPKVTLYVKLPKKGKLIAIAYCTKHGLWKAEKEVQM